MTPLDKDTFEIWAKEIISRLDRLDGNRKAKRIFYDEQGCELLDNADLCAELKVSKRTLQRYRDSGTLPYQMLYHKTLYKESDVKFFIRNHFSNFKKRKSKN